MFSRICVREAEATIDVMLGSRPGKSTLRRAIVIVEGQADTDRQVVWPFLADKEAFGDECV